MKCKYNHLLNKNLQNTMDKAVKGGKKTGNEFLCFIGADDGRELIPPMEGDSGSVVFPQSTIDFLLRAKKEVLSAYTIIPAAVRFRMAICA